MRKVLIGALAILVLAVTPAAASEAPPPPVRNWSFQGIFGTFDRPALRRGMQVYTEICASCHSLRLLAYRNLTAIGLSEAEVKKVASTFEVTDGPNDQGDMYTRPARPSDHFASPYPNTKAARAANNGALPPDLSLIIKARKGGPNYVYGILTGFKAEPPAGFHLADGMFYNEYFPGHQIAMPPPLVEDAVEYADGTKATVPQMAHDVVTFLSWAAQPELEARKRLGIKVMLFLIVLTAMFYALKRHVWADVH